ncbi:MAG: glycosyltransferase [Pirellulaceae bacterium]
MMLHIKDDRAECSPSRRGSGAVKGDSEAARRLIVFSDDWGRHPSSCQHLVRHLLDDCQVTWINTIGTRSPRVDFATARRGFEKLTQWKRPRPAPAHESAPRVCNPLMWPGFRTPWQRGLNRRLLQRFLQRRVDRPDDSTVLTTIPVVADLLDAVSVRRWVYFCVDDFSAWPGLDSRPLREMEAKLVERADCLIAAGDNLAARMHKLGREATVITHGIDLDHWSQSPAPDPMIQSLPGPVVLFWGLIDRRLDIELLIALNRRMTAGTIALVGPEQNPDPALDQLSRLRRLGPVPYSRLPAIAAAADVLIMPYADLPVTRAMQPLKLKEYLATGKPVVTRRLPAIAPWENGLDAVENADDFVAAVLARVKMETPPSQLTARCALANESWREKAADLRRMLFWDETT